MYVGERGVLQDAGNIILYYVVYLMVVCVFVGAIYFYTKYYKMHRDLPSWIRWCVSKGAHIEISATGVLIRRDINSKHYV